MRRLNRLDADAAQIGPALVVADDQQDIWLFSRTLGSVSRIGRQENRQGKEEWPLAARRQSEGIRRLISCPKS